MSIRAKKNREAKTELVRRSELMALLVDRDKMRKMIADIPTLQETRAWQAQIAAFQKLAQAAGVSLQEQNYIGEARLRTERKGGEFLARMEKNPGAAATRLHAATTLPTYAELGIEKTWAFRWQIESSVPDDVFEEFIRESFEHNREITSAALIAIARDGSQKELPRSIQVPEGFFHVLVVDPPWPMEKIQRDVDVWRQQGFDYPTLSIDEIKDYTFADGRQIPDLAPDDAHLFLWTTQRFLLDAFSLVSRWKFHYVCVLVWHKTGGFQPFGLPQYNCEFVIYARKGSPIFIDTKDFFCCFEAPRREHSRKPEEFYELIRRVTMEPRIDIFSREPHEGFAQAGNEITKFATGGTHEAVTATG